MTLSLKKQIKIAITNNDIDKMYELKDICDRMHSTGEGYKNYIPGDLPTDTLYEELVRKIDSSAYDLRIVSQKGLETNASYVRKDGQGISTNEVKHRHEKYISDMWMGSITKETEIKEIKNAMLLPKYDGCSCGVRIKRNAAGKFELVEALTRGNDKGYSVKKSNITDKFAQISTTLLSSFSSNEFQFKNKRKLSEATCITLRGEIVLKRRDTTDSAPASFAAGKINGGFDVWEKAINLLEFIPYEIMRIYFSDDPYDIYVPTQSEVIELLGKFDLFDTDIIDYLDLSPNSLDYVIQHFHSLESIITEPIDGVVYCSQDWKYPLRKEETTPKSYGKYAWKPSSEATTILQNINYSLARDGKFTFILCYEPIKINGKTYKQAKTATSRLLNFKGIGIGSIITVKLAGDISPMIDDFINESDDIIPYEIPNKCPFCNKQTQLKNGKTPTLSCVNPSCPEVLKQKMKNFLSELGIKGIAEGKLNALESITLFQVDKTYLTGPRTSRTRTTNDNSLLNILKRTDTRTFLKALGLGGRTKIDKMIPAGMNPLNNVINNFNAISELLEPYYSTDPFIVDIMEYVDSLIN